jgi:hypothetical protein
MSLSKEEVQVRMVEWRNLTILHQKQKARIQKLEAEVTFLKQENVLLRTENTELKTEMQTIKLQVEELRTMVFGRKKRKDKDDEPPQPPITRTPDSYHRPLPTEDEVTEEKSHPIDACTHCSTTLTRKKTVTYYIEDIPLPQKKVVTKHMVEKGYCTTCKKWQSATPIPCATVTLDERVQTYVAYLSIIARLSFAQIRQLLYDTYTFSISDGEIAKILKRQAATYRPAYEQLKEDIRGAPIVHMDETGWKLLYDGSNSYAWSMSTPEGVSVYLVGESRGKGNVDKLLGEDYRGIVVTDDYAAYKKILLHQLCWAHILRKFRDVAQSEEMDEPTKAHHTKEYQTLATIYQSVRDHRDPSLLERYTQQLGDFARRTVEDCKKLQTYKATLFKNIPAYLLCLTDPRIPMTNNQAERSLRHLVLKRKVSFGSHSKETADTLAVLLSVFLSKRSQNPKGWFGELLGV